MSRQAPSAAAAGRAVGRGARRRRGAAEPPAPQDRRRVGARHPHGGRESGRRLFSLASVVDQDGNLGIHAYDTRTQKLWECTVLQEQWSPIGGALTELSGRQQASLLAVY